MTKEEKILQLADYIDRFVGITNEMYPPELEFLYVPEYGPQDHHHEALIELRKDMKENLGK